MAQRKSTPTIQATAKRWKLLILLGALVILAGASCIAVAVASEEAGFYLFGGGALLSGAGLVALLFGRFMAWWHHG